MKNTMILKIDAKSKNEAFARSTVGAFCVELNPTIEEINDIKTAVSEAVTNAIVHGYKNGDGIITIKTQIIDNSVHIDVIDDGCGIEDVYLAKVPFYTSKPEDERSGMGFTVMESFMDSLIVNSTKGGGTCVKMVKAINVNNEEKEEKIARTE